MARSTAYSVVEQKQIHDLPVVTSGEARGFFGISRERFRKRFVECLHREIRSVKTRYGERYVLVDVIKSAFPDAEDYTVHKMALEYLEKRAEERRHVDARKKKGGRHL